MSGDRVIRSVHSSAELSINAHNHTQVVAIPTNRPPLREDTPLRVYFNPSVRSVFSFEKVLKTANVGWFCMFFKVGFELAVM